MNKVLGPGKVSRTLTVRDRRMKKKDIPERRDQRSSDTES